MDDFTLAVRVKLNLCGYQLREVDITPALGFALIAGFFLGLIYGGT